MGWSGGVFTSPGTTRLFRWKKAEWFLGRNIALERNPLVVFGVEQVFGDTHDTAFFR